MTRPRIVSEDITQFWGSHQRAADAPAKDILFQFWPGLSGPVDEEVVGIKHVVSEKLESIPVPFLRASSQDGVDVSAAIPTLASIVTTAPHPSLLAHAWSLYRRLSQFTEL